MMKVKINETNEYVELSTVDANGVDWVGDMIGNSGDLHKSFTYDPETDEWSAGKDTVDWWMWYISNYEQDERDISDLFGRIRNQYGYEIAEKIKQAFDDDAAEPDYTWHHQQKRCAIGDVQETYLKWLPDFSVGQCETYVVNGHMVTFNWERGDIEVFIDGEYNKSAGYLLRGVSAADTLPYMKGVSNILEDFE